MNHCTKCTTLGSCPMTQSGSCKFQTPKLQNQQPKITFRNIKQRWLLYSGSSRKNWATFQSMTRACLMCGQTFRYVAFCYFFGKGKLSSMLCKISQMRIPACVWSPIHVTCSQLASGFKTNAIACHNHCLSVCLYNPHHLNQAF